MSGSEMCQCLQQMLDQVFECDLRYCELLINLYCSLSCLLSTQMFCLNPEKGKVHLPDVSVGERFSKKVMQAAKTERSLKSQTVSLVFLMHPFSMDKSLKACLF